MKYPVVLTPVQTRILGCLIEKEATTPDNYPLSLNALTNACNQKTNRDPVMDLGEATVQEGLDDLIKKTLAAARSGAGSRVTKYVHRLNDRLREDFDFSRPELAVLGLLFVRGPQTPGELRSRSGRIHEFSGTNEVLAALAKLEEREDGPYVVRLARQPGQKESRYAHLFSGEVDAGAAPARAEAAAPLSDDAARIAELEHKVGMLERELQALAERFDGFARQFE